MTNSLMKEYNEAHVKTDNLNKGETNMTNIKATQKGKGMQVTKDNLQDIVDMLSEDDKKYLILNNIRIINPLTNKIGKRFRHYVDVVKGCEHKNTVRNSYQRRSGECFFTVCSDCGMMTVE